MMKCWSECKYLGSIIDGSVVIYDRIIEAAKTVPAKSIPKNFNKKS